AQRVMMSRRTLTRHFMKATGSSVAEWLIAERLRRSQELLESSPLPVERIAEQVGFLSPVTWRQHFKSHFGVSPAEWRKTFRGV
ncbi:TPA: helix-turn-helix domain-containing protein, partial [Citrobacter freundii]|nr:helix-turn-helix domain-containing protein [Citrobacter freundii]